MNPKILFDAITKPLKKCMNHKYKLSVEEQLTDEDFYYYPKYSMHSV